MTKELSIILDQKWFDLISERIKNTNEFNSVEEYVNYALSEIFSENNDEPYTVEEKAEIEKNLKDLGYL